MGKLGTVEHSFTIGDTEITFEGGKLAALAGGAVVASVGDTKVLSTTTASSKPKEFLGFFPLTIDVEERMYAAGQIPGSFFKREGRPSENAILTCRLTDRPLRPTFKDGLRNEIQVVNTILQTTKKDPYDVVAMNGASVSTMLAVGSNFDGPVASLRYAMLRDGSWVAFPDFETLETEAVFNMVVAGRVEASGDVAILMIEAEATTESHRMIDMGATAPTEEVIGKAIEDMKPLIKSICEAQQTFVDMLGAREVPDFKIFIDYTDEVFAVADEFATQRVFDVYADASLGKEAKDEALSVIKDEMVAHVVANGPADLEEDERSKQASAAFRSIEKKSVRKLVTEKGVRIDGRGPADIRPLEADVDLLPMTHGNGYFKRGDTQVLSTLALGSMRESQRIDTLDPVDEKNYMHHYNFPPYSTGETGRVGSPKRREVGHGLLAERALKPVLPTEDEWPYVMRIVSDIMASNGSTSMASVCGSTLALMDGGVPIHAPVAGIAMGLIYENGTYTTLTDIQGTEDFFGDMDFKVAGTKEFVTALQLDTKLAGIPAEVLADALLQAKDARLQILEVMLEAIAEPREQVKSNAPRVISLTIPMDKIGEVIGPKGKIIREITEETGANVDVDDDGSRGIVRIYADSSDKAQAAADRVNAIANPVIPGVGERYHATVVKTVDFGAFVNLTPGTDGLLHISKLSKKFGKRLNHAEEVVNVGDKVWVEIEDVVDGRKFKLDFVDEDGNSSNGSSDDDAPKAKREDRDDAPKAERSERSDRGDRGGRERGGRDRSRRGGSDDKAGNEASSNDSGSNDSGDGSGEGERTRTRTRSRSRD